MRNFRKIFFGSRNRAFLSGLLCFALVSGAEYVVRNEVSIDVFYFLPIFIMTWFGGRALGLVTAGAGVCLWLLDERLLTTEMLTHLQLVGWNAMIRLGFFLVVVLLIDRIKTLVDQARTASELKSAMIHTVSHEFNNALTGLSAGLFLLKETDAASGDATRKDIYSSMEAAQRKLALYVKNILNDARMAEGRFRIQKTPILLRSIASGVAESLRELIRQKGIALELDFPEAPLRVNADREALALVISNLIGNAAKYTGKGGKITVKVAPVPSDKVAFSVADSGIGISLDEMEKITTGFYRTEEGKARADGFGLGLKISNDLLELHGSRLQIWSEKGKGSKFFFELPECREGAAVDIPADHVIQ